MATRCSGLIGKYAEDGGGAGGEEQVQTTLSKHLIVKEMIGMWWGWL